MLSDESEQVMYSEGEIFLHKDVATAQVLFFYSI